VFTGTDDSSGNYTAAEAATRLFNTSKEGMRGRHWNGYGWDERTFVMDSGIRTLVVGMIDPSANDIHLLKVKQSLNALARAGNPIMVRDASGKEVYVPNPNAEAYFATDVTGLVASLRSILTQLTSRPFAGGSPVVLPVQADKNKKVLFSSSYRINAMDQWDSWFKKSVLSGDVEEVESWEFNAKKLVPGAQSRKIYTFSHTSGDLKTDVRPLSSMSGKTLEDLAGVPENKARDFVNWLHEYNRAQILGDMEYSTLQVVGAPEAEVLSDDARVAGRKHVIYLQTNRGVLHAADYENGDELWAFIPPNIFQTRLKALKFSPTGNWYAGDGVNSLKSLPHNLLSGPLTARDVSVNFNASDYRTILIGNLGWGGNGLYAMDATNPSGTPEFLWALDNDRYDGGPSKTVAVWGKAAASSKTGYEKLGLTIAPAAFLWAGVSASDKTHIVFLPGGLGYGLGQDDHGKAFYAISPLDGTILRVFEDGSGFKGPIGSQLGMAVAPVSILEDEQRNTGLVTADSQGNVLYCDTTPPLDKWELKSVFQLRDSGGNPVSIPKALSVGMTAGSQMWVYGGSSELQAPGRDANGRQRRLFNAQNYIFGFNLTKTSGDAELTIADPGMKALKYIKDESPSLPPFGSPRNAGDNRLDPAAAKGWYLPLRPALSAGRVNNLPEYVTTPPLLRAGILYVSTFIPRVKTSNEDEACPDAGYSKIYALDPLTGSGRWKDLKGSAQAVLIGNIKITGMAIQGSRMYVAVKPLNASALKNLPPQVSGNRYILPDETLWSFELPEEEVQASPTIDTNTPYIQYWRDMINP
jgi:type IV pilus assembly protein PilY1